MAINWNWNKKHGEVYIRSNEKTYKCNAYFGNCMLIVVYEFKDTETGKDKYQFVTFLNDINHLKSRIRNNDLKEFKKVRINTFWWDKYSSVRKEDIDMISVLTQGGVKVELYYKREK